jgi:uncharacterized membrane protein YvbJ
MKKEFKMRKIYLLSLAMIVSLMIFYYGCFLKRAMSKPAPETIYNAIDENNIDKVAELIEKGVDINNIPQNQENSPLNYAIYKRRVEITKLLISKGAKISPEIACMNQCA